MSKIIDLRNYITVVVRVAHGVEDAISVFELAVEHDVWNEDKVFETVDEYVKTQFFGGYHIESITIFSRFDDLNGRVVY